VSGRQTQVYQGGDVAPEQTVRMAVMHVTPPFSLAFHNKDRPLWGPCTGSCTFSCPVSLFCWPPAGCDFRYHNPGGSFNPAAVHGVVARLVRVQDPSTSLALEVAAGGKLYQVCGSRGHCMVHCLVVDCVWLLCFISTCSPVRWQANAAVMVDSLGGHSSATFFPSKSPA
jgi:hypothetical protein